MVECVAVSILKCSIGDVFDPHIGNVVLLLGLAAHGTGTDHGNAQIDTAQFTVELFSF
jgi:hypothetical protein